MPSVTMSRAPRPVRLWARTIRLGVLTSLGAALATVVVRALTPVPVLPIVILAALVAFTLSWHVAYPPVVEGRPARAADNRPQHDRPPVPAA